MTYVTTLRLPDELAAEAELIARVEGESMSAFIAQAVAERIHSHRANPEFQEKLREHIEDMRRVSDRLAPPERIP